MTVNDFKETSCASAGGKVRDFMRLEVKFDGDGEVSRVRPTECGENLLGKVLEGEILM